MFVVISVLLDGFLVHALSHQAAQLEERKFFTTDLNGFSSLGITSRVGFILFHFEAAKATNLNPFTLCQSIKYALKEGINADFRIS